VELPLLSPLNLSGNRRVKSFRLAQIKSGPTHPTVAWTLYNYSYMLWRKGDYRTAEQVAGEVLALRSKTLNDEHPMIASSLQVVGRSLMGQGRAKDAES